MRAAVVSDDRALRIDEVPIDPEPGEVLVRVRACGICGTDLHAVQHPETFDTRPGDVLGHEFCGVVVDTTPGERGGDTTPGEPGVQVPPGITDWAPGDRVVVQPLMPCGACDVCRDGYRSRCRRGRAFGLGRGAVPGAFAEFARVSPHALYRIPDHVSDRAAALTEPFAVGIHAVQRTRVQPGDACLIMGGGPVGVFTLLAALRAGAGPIIVSEFAAGRRRLCERLGAAAVVDPADTDPGRVMRELTGAAPPVVFDAVGTPPTLQEATRLAGRDGRVGIVGVCIQPHTLQPLTAIVKDLDLHYSWAWTDANFQEALDAIAAGDLPVDEIVTDVIGLDDLPAMFASLSHPTTQGKVIVQP